MIRSEQQIINDMGALPQGISDAPNTEMAGWRIMAAKVVRMIEQLIYSNNTQIDQILTRKQYGTQQWYKAVAIQYQHGDTLAIDEYGLPGYAQPDAEKQIIAQCAVQALDGVIHIKVAKLVDGLLAPLDNDEYNAFLHYMKMRMPIGLSLILISTAPDLIRLNADLYISSQHMTATIEDEVKEKLLAYRDSFEFNGIITLSDLYNVFGEVQGLKSAEITQLGWYAPDFGSDFEPITRATTYSGYFNYRELRIRLKNKEGNILQTITEL